MSHLSQEIIHQLPESIIVPAAIDLLPTNHILHIGVGGFHRSHQAYAIAKLLELDPVAYQAWRITGVGLMPNDRILMDAFKEQDNLYALRTVAADQSEEVTIINAISEMLHAQSDAPLIIDKIADSNTKLISFTITEGGYNFDFKNNRFLLENELIQHDLISTNQPKTVFGFLARGLQKRRQNGQSGLTLLSCDNIIGNGKVLEHAVLSFLGAFDVDLKKWAQRQLQFPNSMVDRITPTPNEHDKNAFQQQYGFRDNCLVVAEDYFQWVIEKPVGDPNFPPLGKIGVEFVQDVSVYEEMKLGVLNAGHTLVGLLGDALGYQTIHDAVADKDIAAAYKQFCLQEVIPVLPELPKLDYTNYFEKVRSRFSNAMINDSTARIISGSSDKFPKFVLPTVQKQFRTSDVKVSYAALIAAAWWNYLNREMQRNDMEEVQDQKRAVWKEIFQNEQLSITAFLAYDEVFDNLSQKGEFVEAYQASVLAFQQGRIRPHLQFLNHSKS